MNLAWDDIVYRMDCEGITTDALQELFRAAGLGGREGHKILRAFRNSSIACFALTGGRLIGACRALTDSEYHAFIYDLAVHPERQRRGIGRELMSRVLAGIRVWRVMLVADPEVQGFYRQFGFAHHGDVMARCDRQWLFDRES